MTSASRVRLWLRVALATVLVTGCGDDDTSAPGREDGGVDAGQEVRDAAPIDAQAADARAADAQAADARADDASDAASPDCPGDRWLSAEEDLAILRGCTTIGGNLSTTGNLTRLELPNLVAVEGFLTVWVNPSLTSASFPKLARIGGYLDVSNNDVLTQLSLPALQSVNQRRVNAVSDVAIKDNAKLPACQAEQLRDRLRANGYPGSITVSGNGGVCSP